MNTTKRLALALLSSIAVVISFAAPAHAAGWGLYQCNGNICAQVHYTGAAVDAVRLNNGTPIYPLTGNSITVVSGNGAFKGSANLGNVPVGTERQFNITPITVGSGGCVKFIGSNGPGSYLISAGVGGGPC